MRIAKILAIAAFVTSLVCSCKEHTNDVSDVGVFITPYASDTVVVNSGENQRYEMTMHAVHRLHLTSYDAVYGVREVLDTIFNPEQSNYDFVYKTLQYNADTTLVTLTFDVYNASGAKGSTRRYLKVAGRQILLQELTGIVLRNPASNLPNALCFREPTQPFFFKMPEDGRTDSTLLGKMADLVIQSNAAFDNISICSNTGARFVRNNNFDYPLATGLNLQTVYESSRRDTGIDNLRVNDIVLFGHDNVVEGVLSVTDIVRNAAVDEQSVRLSLKQVVTSK